MITRKEKTFYLKRVKRHCPFYLRKRLLPELSGAISDFIEENPDAKIDDLKARFGEAERYAEEYRTEMSAAERTMIFRKERTIITVIIAAILAISLIFIGSYFWITHNNDDPFPVYDYGVINK